MDDGFELMDGDGDWGVGVGFYFSGVDLLFDGNEVWW